MARYIKKEIADLNGTGKKQAYYRMQTWRKLSHNEFIKKCTYPGSGVSHAMMDAVLTVVGEELSRLMAMGYSVRIDGLGTFNAKLGVRKDKLTRDKSFIDDLAADTLDHIELIMAVEEEFELCIIDEDAERINTVGDLIDYVKAKVEGK